MGLSDSQWMVDVSDGLTLPWITGDLNSKPLQQTPVSENGSETGYGGYGHQADISGVTHNICFRGTYQGWIPECFLPTEIRPNASTAR